MLFQGSSVRRGDGANGRWGEFVIGDFVMVVVVVVVSWIQGLRVRRGDEAKGR
jgi:hypothetical protein